jgi:hypothetical protein
MRGLLAGALALSTATFALAQEPVTWTNGSNVAAEAGFIVKNDGCDGCDDAGAISRQTIRSGDGFVEFSVGENDNTWIAGLSRPDTRPGGDAIDFAISGNSNGWADIVENGRYIGRETEYRSGDVFRIEVSGGRVRYLKDGRVMHVSDARPRYPLAFEVALRSVGATIADARIEGSDGRTLTEFGDRANDGRFANDDQFNRLDANGDGRISRREWSGTRATFRQRDVNQDGQITRREMDRDQQFGRSDDPFATVGTSGEFIIVSSTERWTDTGLTVRAGDRISLDAEGRVQMSGPQDTASPAGAQRYAPQSPLPDRPAGTLIGRIGDGEPFVVGANRTIARAPTSGRLFLGVNDDHLADNSGQFEVLVTIEPR